MGRDSLEFEGELVRFPPFSYCPPHTPSACVSFVSSHTSHDSTEPLEREPHGLHMRTRLGIGSFDAKACDKALTGVVVQHKTYDVNKSSFTAKTDLSAHQCPWDRLCYLQESDLSSLGSHFEVARL
eukprot:5437934-Pyramimonas_sp.AAC.1